MELQLADKLIFDDEVSEYDLSFYLMSNLTDWTISISFWIVDPALSGLCRDPISSVIRFRISFSDLIDNCAVRELII